MIDWAAAFAKKIENDEDNLEIGIAGANTDAIRTQKHEKKDSNEERLKTNITDIFKCNICSFKTWKKSYLKKHAVVHVIERNFECNICQKKFKNNDHVHAHRKVAHAKSMKDLIIS